MDREEEYEKEGRRGKKRDGEELGSGRETKEKVKEGIEFRKEKK